MKSRIKELRENRGVMQTALADELGITQQMLSRYETNVLCIKADILKKMADYFNVTTDYLLEISDVKRDLQGQIRVSRTLDEYYDKSLDIYDRELVWSIMQAVKKSAEKRKIKVKAEEKS